MDTGYKYNLLLNTRYQVAKLGGKVRVTGHGNKRHVLLTAKDGRSCVVWYPTESRVRDLELADLKDAVLWITGLPAFSHI